jgi:glycosyltransferase involved in cell wall biosynthesis
MLKPDLALPPVVIDWQLSSYFGWGVYGLNLMLQWWRGQRRPLLTSCEVNPAAIDINAFEWAMLRPAVERSRELRARLEPFRDQLATIRCPVLQGLGNDFINGKATGSILGTPNLGVTFFEETQFSADGLERAKAYRLIVAGSSWNRTVLEAAGVGPVALALQGIDPTVFHPAPKAGWFAGRFAIFSGGKLEYRKGQDLVLKAFRIFAQRHPDALLVTAWASPWPGIARNLDADSGLAPVVFQPSGKLDITAWAAASGIPPHQFIDLGQIANSAMPRLYREMDVGLFPNRCEGGTNLVAMECMACGIPVILSSNTGHLDLITPDRCFPLEHQSVVDGALHVGWGESSVEEIVATLEAVRENRAESLARAKRGADFMSTLTWAQTAQQLADVIEPYIA